MEPRRQTLKPVLLLNKHSNVSCLTEVQLSVFVWWANVQFVFFLISWYTSSFLFLSSLGLMGPGCFLLFIWRLGQFNKQAVIILSVRAVGPGFRNRACLLFIL